MERPPGAIIPSHTLTTSSYVQGRFEFTYSQFCEVQPNVSAALMSLFTSPQAQPSEYEHLYTNYTIFMCCILLCEMYIVFLTSVDATVSYKNIQI
jgi:hypothetical protein